MNTAHKRVARLLVPLAVVAGCAVPTAAQGPAPATAPAAEASRPARMVARNDDRLIVMGILAAEFSLQNGDIATAAATYYEVAKRSRDAKVAERAVELLLRARRMDDAREIASLWQASEDATPRAHLVALALSLNGEQPDRAAAERALDRISGLPDDLRRTAIMDAARQFAQLRDRDLAVALATRWTEARNNEPEAFYALAAATTGTQNARLNEALLAIDRALVLRPRWPQAIAVKSRILLARNTAKDKAAAVELLTEASRASPETRELRVLLARTLFDLERFAEARALFLTLAESHADDANESRLAASVAAYYAQDWPTAEREFQDALAAGRGDPSAIRFYLARVAEAQKRWSDAAARFAQVTSGERVWEAQLRLANALAQDKRLLQAVSHLQGLKPGTVGERISLAQAEAGLWRDAGELDKALAVLDRALATDQDDPDLLYEGAMIAERMERFDDAEKRLRRVIVLQPARAHAYNALGYSFADRNIHLDEARTLIERAHGLAADDPAILDSMGWIAFRQGRIDDALHFLRQAFEKFKDGEIAAHLGEVLWVAGRRDEARSVWQTQLKAQPDSDILKKTMSRLDR
ncbi:MAG: tetratricopeptide repeat protein [Burkholderiales bacterium]|nr:tetratricopeptide repeat protein [Burkholderiales bacterium]